MLAVEYSQLLSNREGQGLAAFFDIGKREGLYACLGERISEPGSIHQSRYCMSVNVVATPKFTETFDQPIDFCSLNVLHWIRFEICQTYTNEAQQVWFLGRHFGAQEPGSSVEWKRHASLMVLYIKPPLRVSGSCDKGDPLLQGAPSTCRDLVKQRPFQSLCILKIGDAGIYGSLNVRLCVLFETSSDGSRQKILRRATY